MKNQLQRILILTSLAMTAFATVSLGQESDMLDYEMSDADREKMIYTPGGEGEVRYKSSTEATRNVNTPKDSVATTKITPLPPRPKVEQAPKSSEKQNTPRDESILSFNFLYYIIQKYKLQDIVD